MPPLSLRPAVARFVFVLAAIAAFANPALASMLINTSTAIDFTKPADAVAKAAWSENLSLNDAGLGWDASPATFPSGWLQTKPLATGLWWRPAPGASVSVEISPPPAPITLASGQTYTPWRGSVYARYSADKQHWSSWQKLNFQEPPAADVSATSTNGVSAPPPAPQPLRFTGTLGVPARNREAYVRHLETYSRLDVPWTSDENALAHWIVAKEPDFFARNIPFVGYIEFLFEHDFPGGHRIASVKISAGIGLGGTHAVPRDAGMLNAIARDNSPWRFPDPSAATAGTDVD